MIFRLRHFVCIQLTSIALQMSYRNVCLEADQNSVISLRVLTSVLVHGVN